MSIRFHPLATREYRKARAWYANQSESAPRRFIAAVNTAVLRIAEAPETHPVVVGAYHAVRVRRFPYQLIYRMESAESAVVVAVAHTSRRPGYWRRRH